MILLLQPSELRRARTTGNPAMQTSRMLITPKFSILLEIRWKEWESLGEVTAAWVEVTFMPEPETALWIRIDPFPLSDIACLYADQQIIERV